VRLVGAGLTAAVAVGFAASPALAEAGFPSAAGVQPDEVPWPGGEPVCGEGEIPLRVEQEFQDGDVFETDIPGEGTGTVTVTVVGDEDTPPGQTFEFSTGPQPNPPSAVRRVFVKGGPDTQNLYVYDAEAGFPNGVTSDELLHAPINLNSALQLPYGLSHIDFCFIPDVYDGNGTATG
jgi:hypothetical protein